MRDAIDELGWDLLLLVLAQADAHEGGAGPLPLTHNPSAPVLAHVTEDLQRLSLVPIQVNCVEPRGGFSIQESLGAVFRVRIEKTSCTHKKEKAILKKSAITRNLLNTDDS